MSLPERLSFQEKLAYGLGDTASNFYFQFFNLFLVFYYTDIFGLAPAAVGTMMLALRVFDAVIDPAVGVLADRTNTRWGKFRPYILWGAIPYGVAGYAMFLNPGQKAYAINPGSAAAAQEVRRTTEMIERERKRVEETGKESTPKERALTEGEKAKKETEDRIDSILGVPQLRAIDPSPIHLRMNGSAKLLFETVAKVAGLNVLWDPEYQPQVKNSIPVEFENSTLEEALDYLAVITKSYWKPLSSNTIFITMDNPNKRRDYEEQVAKVFYLSNVSTPQELQEIVNAVRSVADIQRFFPYNAQNAIIAKGSADQVALAEKILHDLDKPRSEVVVDIIVMEASSI